MAEDQNVEVMQRLAELWERGDHAAIGELLHEDVVMITTPEWPVTGPHHGRAEFLDAVDQWLAPWDRMDLRVIDIRPRGERVAVHGRWVSRGQASGAENELDFGVVVDFDAGLIKRLEFFTEPAQALGPAGG